MTRRHTTLWRAVVVLVGLAGSVGLPVAACGPPKVPAGPEPEYERPLLAPWDAAPPQDPFALVEADADWVDDEPSGAAGAAP